MTTTIVPSVGNAPLMLQAGTGASPGYQAIDVRRIASDFELGEGVSTYGSFLVQQRGAGANMSVDIGMDDVAWIRGDAITLQGLYPCPPHSATINETVTTADATNPRIDRIILELKDTTHDASGSNLVQTRVVAGTPTSGATLDNLTGAAAVPASTMLLADVLIPAASSSVTNANIRDRRPFIVGIPPVLTDVDMVALDCPFLSLTTGAATTITSVANNAQLAVLMRIPRRIASATRIRWKYLQGSTAATGNYVLGIYDSSGRKIIDTGSVALTGAANSLQVRSETITATTFEPGFYYLLFGIASIAGGMSFAPLGYTMQITTGTASPVTNTPSFVNVAASSASGGITAPTTILGFTDASSLTASPAVLGMPSVSLSVG